MHSLFRVRSAPCVLLLTLATISLGACKQTTEPSFTDNVTISISFAGAGRVYSPDPGAKLDCYGNCIAGFYDAGGVGTFDAVAEPASGWQFDSWGGDCAGVTTDICTLSFAAVPATFDLDVAFVPIPEAIVLSDDFDGSSGCDDWSETTSTSGVPGTSSQLCRVAGGSDGGAYRQMTHELPDEGAIVVDHQYDGATVLAGAGGGEATCIETVRFTEQRVISSPAFEGAAVGSSVWISQGDIRYRASLGQFNDTGWTAFDSGPLTAADFTPAGLDLCPASATPLTFGYARSNTNTSAGVSQVNVHGIDEWSVTIQPGS